MKIKAFYATREYMHKHLGSIVTFISSAFLVLLLALGFAQLASAQTFTSITAQAGPGARGANVTNIQTYLASNPAFYPEGLVTGYYGSLTTAAVQRFQAFYGIVSSGSPTTTGYGRVGPSTLARMNSLIAGGGGGTTPGDLSAPYISGITVSPSSTGASIAWTTHELATGRVYYGTTPIRFNEGNERSVGFAVTSGQAASFDTTTRLSHGATLSGLSPNTTYYYLIVATDPSGNVSISLPGATFRTGI
jgi:peptidoglycan hydrolase-like protein with peptidoglycan-binding domain